MRLSRRHLLQLGCSSLGLAVLGPAAILLPGVIFGR